MYIYVNTACTLHCAPFCISTNMEMGHNTLNIQNMFTYMIIIAIAKELIMSAKSVPKNTKPFICIYFLI